MRVESRRCVGVSAISQTLSRTAPAAVNVPVRYVGSATAPRVVSLSRYPTGTLAIGVLLESYTVARRPMVCPPSMTVSRGPTLTRAALAPGPTYTAVSTGAAALVADNTAVPLAWYHVSPAP